MEQEILRAPPPKVAALKFACLFLAGLAFVALAKLLAFPYMRTYLNGAASRVETIHRVQVIFNWFGGFLLLVVCYMAWVSYRVILTGQWPLPGALVFRDTPIRRGRSVYLRGLALSALTVAMSILAVLTFFLPQSLLPK